MYKTTDNIQDCKKILTYDKSHNVNEIFALCMFKIRINERKIMCEINSKITLRKNIVGYCLIL